MKEERSITITITVSHPHTGGGCRSCRALGTPCYIACGTPAVSRLQVDHSGYILVGSHVTPFVPAGRLSMAPAGHIIVVHTLAWDSVRGVTRKVVAGAGGSHDRHLCGADYPLQE